MRYFVAQHRHEFGVWDSQRPAAMEPVESFMSLTAARLSAEVMERQRGDRCTEREPHPNTRSFK